MKATNRYLTIDGKEYEIWTSFYPSNGALAVILSPKGYKPLESDDEYVISVNMDHGQDHESKDLPKNCFYVPIWHEELGPAFNAALSSEFFRTRPDLPISHSGYVRSPAWEYLE